MEMKHSIGMAIIGPVLRMLLFHFHIDKFEFDAYTDVELNIVDVRRI